jgi:beta-glucosidase
VIVCVGFGARLEQEGSDRPFELPWEQEALVRRCVEANRNTIAVIFAGGAVGMDSWVDDAGAVLYGWYPGEHGALAIAEILFGLTNPSGKLPISIERRWHDSAAYKNYLPEDGTWYETPDYVGRPRPIFDIRYEEGIFCGYRHYDQRNIEPLFSFGHGLSYSTFEYSSLSLDLDEKGAINVSFSVKAVGALPGTEIAQVYVGDVECSVPRPYRELKAFESVTLQPGESKTIQIKLGKKAFSYYDVTKKDWHLEPGLFRIMIGSSIKDIRLEGTITL